MSHERTVSLSSSPGDRTSSPSLPAQLTDGSWWVNDAEFAATDIEARSPKRRKISRSPSTDSESTPTTSDWQHSQTKLNSEWAPTRGSAGSEAKSRSPKRRRISPTVPKDMPGSTRTRSEISKHSMQARLQLTPNESEASMVRFSSLYRCHAVLGQDTSDKITQANDLAALDDTLWQTQAWDHGERMPINEGSLMTDSGPTTSRTVDLPGTGDGRYGCISDAVLCSDSRSSTSRLPVAERSIADSVSGRSTACSGWRSEGFRELVGRLRDAETSDECAEPTKTLSQMIAEASRAIAPKPSRDRASLRDRGLGRMSGPGSSVRPQRPDKSVAASMEEPSTSGYIDPFPKGTGELVFSEPHRLDRSSFKRLESASFEPPNCRSLPNVYDKDTERYQAALRSQHSDTMPSSSRMTLMDDRKRVMLGTASSLKMTPPRDAGETSGYETQTEALARSRLERDLARQRQSTGRDSRGLSRDIEGRWRTSNASGRRVDADKRSSQRDNYVQSRDDRTRLSASRGRSSSNESNRRSRSFGKQRRSPSSGRRKLSTSRERSRQSRRRRSDSRGRRSSSRDASQKRQSHRKSSRNRDRVRRRRTPVSGRRSSSGSDGRSYRDKRRQSRSVSVTSAEYEYPSRLAEGLPGNKSPASSPSRHHQCREGKEGVPRTRTPEADLAGSVGGGLARIDRGSAQVFTNEQSASLIGKVPISTSAQNGGSGQPEPRDADVELLFEGSVTAPIIPDTAPANSTTATTESETIRKTLAIYEAYQREQKAKLRRTMAIYKAYSEGNKKSQTEGNKKPRTKTSRWAKEPEQGSTAKLATTKADSVAVSKSDGNAKEANAPQDPDARARQLHEKIVIINNKLRAGVVDELDVAEIPKNVAFPGVLKAQVFLPSMSPLLREVTWRAKLRAERHALVCEIRKIYPAYEEPSDGGKVDVTTGRESARVFLPVSKYPDINFVGALIGFKGRMLAKLQSESGTVISIVGKSVGINHIDKSSDEPPHAYVVACDQETLKKGVEKVVEVIQSIIKDPDHYKRKKMPSPASNLDYAAGATTRSSAQTSTAQQQTNSNVIRINLADTSGWITDARSGKTKSMSSTHTGPAANAMSRQPLRFSVVAPKVRNPLSAAAIGPLAVNSSRTTPSSSWLVQQDKYGISTMAAKAFGDDDDDDNTGDIANDDGCNRGLYDPFNTDDGPSAAYNDSPEIDNHYNVTSTGDVYFERGLDDNEDDVEGGGQMNSDSYDHRHHSVISGNGYPGHYNRTIEDDCQEVIISDDDEVEVENEVNTEESLNTWLDLLNDVI